MVFLCYTCIYFAPLVLSTFLKVSVIIIRPTILLTGTIRSEPSGYDFYSVGKYYAEAIISSGGTPHLALGGDCDELAFSSDSLLLTGGNDVFPSHFNEQPLNNTVSYTPERDSFEFNLISSFSAIGKPIFGICRGIQVINVFFGGSLYQDLPSQLHVDHGDCVHTVSVATCSPLLDLFGSTFSVNSLHHQSVLNVANSLEVVCRSSDNVVESIRHYSLPIWGVQWHPERMTGNYLSPDLPDMKPLFQRYINIVKDGSTNGKYERLL